MKLGEFIEKFIEPNCLIRLVYRDTIGGGHKTVLDTWSDVTMEWEVPKGKGRNRHYINNEVIGIASIWINGLHADAINIVIEELENQPLIEEVKETSINRCEMLFGPPETNF